MEQTKLKGIGKRDLRNGNWLWMHKCVVECWAKKIKPQGLTIYALLASADYSEEHPGIVFPSQQRMAEVIGLSRASINFWVKVLEKSRLITIDQRSRYYLVYILNKVKCPNTKDGIHPDVKPADILNPDVKPAKPDVSQLTSDVKPADTKYKKEVEELNKYNKRNFESLGFKSAKEIIAEKLK